MAKKFQVQIESWHDDSWETDAEAGCAQDAAERAVQNMIPAAAAYEVIGGEAIEVRVKEVDAKGEECIATWEVETWATFECYATKRK